MVHEEVKKPAIGEDVAVKEDLDVVSAPMTAVQDTDMEVEEQKQGLVDTVRDILSGKALSEDLQKLLTKKKKKKKKAALQKQAEMITEAVLTATPEGLKQLAADQTVMNDLIEIGDEIKNPEVFDKLFEGVKDAEVLRKMIGVRFGVPVGSDAVDQKSNAKYYVDAMKRSNGEDKKWTINGLIHVYRVYKRLPQGDLDKIQCLMTFDTKQVGGVSGAAYGEAGVYHVNYDDNTELSADDEKNIITKSGKFSPNATYTRTNLINIDMTTAHELGHIVDANAPGGRFSEKFDGEGNAEANSLPAVTGWKRHDKGSDAVKLYGVIKSYIPDPYAGCRALSDKEKEIVDEAGRQMIINRNYADDKVHAEMLKAITTKEEFEVEDEEALATELEKAMVIKHIIRARDENDPCYDESFSELPNRQIHEDYLNGHKYWFSYPTAARADSNVKISTYQFRNPGEEFAEMYASYHVSDPKGSKTPPGLKAWYEKNVLKIDPLAKKEEAGETAKSE